LGICFTNALRITRSTARGGVNTAIGAAALAGTTHGGFNKAIGLLRS